VSKPSSADALPPSLRFVVLRHKGVASPHFDLMIETAPALPLATWRCSDWPPKADTQFERLPDHRRPYLDYEGPISRGRGSVKRIAAGDCTINGQTEAAIDVSLRQPNTVAIRLRLP